MGIFGKKIKDAETEEKDTKVELVDNSLDKLEIKSSYIKENVLVSPMMTEKAHDLTKIGKYVFRVTKNASKRSVKYDVEKEYGVTVENVNIVKIPAKRRTVKQDRGYQSVGKKAIVTVKKGETIALFETA